MSRPSAYCCWRCGAALPEDSLPLRRAELCPACNADLHVCRMCGFYNPSVADACEETVATAVGNKERANYCDYFKPSARAFKGAADDAAARARAELDALFGGAPSSAPSTDTARNQSELERLFGLDKD
jgi:hypothetical protein